MRTILQNVYTIHCSSSDDNESFEEALEAHDDLEGGESSGLSSTTRSPSETVESNLSSACNHSDDDPSSSNQNSYLPYGGREMSDSDPLSPHAHSQLLIPPIWVPDELASVCTACFSQFTLIRRRHHCRNCGGIYCNNCCNHYVPLVHYGFFKPVRVCRLCFSSLQQS